MLLLISLLICHYFADYTHLSTNFMLSAKRFGKPLFPIFIHALVHGILMLVVMLILINLDIKIVYAFIFQVITHFIIDTLKGRINLWFPSVQNPANKFHWYVFGFDQLLHQLVIILMWFYLK